MANTFLRIMDLTPNIFHKDGPYHPAYTLGNKGLFQLPCG